MVHLSPCFIPLNTLLTSFYRPRDFLYTNTYCTTYSYAPLPTLPPLTPNKHPTPPHHSHPTSPHNPYHIPTWRPVHQVNNLAIRSQVIR